jgi:hypothetical protein
VSHKDAPPLTSEQARMEQFYREREGTGFCGFGRDKDGRYQSAYAQTAWAAWQYASHLRIAVPDSDLADIAREALELSGRVLLGSCRCYEETLERLQARLDGAKPEHRP